MDIPLIVTELSTYEMAQEFYPQFQLIYRPLSELTLDYLASHFDLIYQCGKFWALELLPLFQFFYQKKMRLVFCPHGNSDKEAIVAQIPLGYDCALAYGDQMHRRLKKTGARHLIKTGNLRLAFYQKNKAHLDHLAETKVFSHFDGTKPIALYAPTWDTEKSPTSFFDSTALLVEKLMPRFHLLIKPHPLLEENRPAHFHRLISHYENKKGVFVLKDFPAIYPLLERTDIYIGDYSSIGYDFLYYDRPLYFLPSKEQTALRRCGASIEKIEQRDRFSKARKKTYKEAFGEGFNLKSVKKEIEKRLYLLE